MEANDLRPHILTKLTQGDIKQAILIPLKFSEPPFVAGSKSKSVRDAVVHRSIGICQFWSSLKKMEFNNGILIPTLSKDFKKAVDTLDSKSLLEIAMLSVFY